MWIKLKLKNFAVRCPRLEMIYFKESRMAQVVYTFKFCCSCRVHTVRTPWSFEFYSNTYLLAQRGKQGCKLHHQNSRGVMGDERSGDCARGIPGISKKMDKGTWLFFWLDVRTGERDQNFNETDSQIWGICRLHNRSDVIITWCRRRMWMFTL